MQRWSNGKNRRVVIEELTLECQYRMKKVDSLNQRAAITAAGIASIGI